MYISTFFMPFSMLYVDFMRFRLFLYKIGLKKKHKMSLPVIVVGNITVGGTGKTPLIIWLARWLKAKGYQPGIVSRGYGGESAHWPVAVDAHSKAEQVGDEAVLLRQRAECPVVVAPKRVQAAQMLIEQTACTIILSDDGLQHYALARDIEIAVIDGERRFGNGYMLPCGPLREPIERLQKVDLLICNGGVAEKNEFSMVVDGTIAINLLSKEKKPLAEFKQQACHALAGIGNPKRFFDLLEREGLLLTSHAFPDHHRFSVADICFEGDDNPIFMSEKDALKCEDFATEKHWFVPVKAQPEAQFIDKLLGLITERTNG